MSELGSGLFWGWGWLAGIGVIILLGVFLLPWFFFLLNLQTLLEQRESGQPADVPRAGVAQLHPGLPCWDGSSTPSSR